MMIVYAKHRQYL